jgi:hypothetical protein
MMSCGGTIAAVTRVECQGKSSIVKRFLGLTSGSSSQALAKVTLMLARKLAADELGDE